MTQTIYRGSTLLWMIALALVCCNAFGDEPGAAEKTATEPTVSQAEASLIQEAERLAQTDLPAAVAKLRAQLAEKPSAALHFSLGVLLSRHGKLEEAEKAYAASVKELPRFARAWEALARIRLALDNPAGAAPALRNAIQYGSPPAELWKLLGHCYLLTDQPIVAESAYRQALLLDPDDRQVVLGLAKTLLERMRYHDALPLLKGLCEEAPEKGEFWLLQANAYLAMDQLKRAIEMMESAYRLGLLAPNDQLTLGDLYYNHQLLNVAAARYDAALRSGKISATRMLRCAEALYRAGDVERAARYLSQARDKGLDEPLKAHLLAGRIAETQADLAAAKNAFQAALKVDPLCGEALMALGSLYWRTRDYELATLTLERASRAHGCEAQALVLLAQIEVELDRFAQAVEHLEAAQEIRPSPRIQRYLEQVRRVAQLEPAE